MSEHAAAELIAHHIETSKRTRKDIAAGSGVSESTLSRIVNRQPVSITTLKTLASFFEIGDEFMSLVSKNTKTGCEFSDMLVDELDKIRTYYETKAVNVRKHYEEQIASLRDQNTRQEEERSRERNMQKETYERSVGYLKEENARIRTERDEVTKKKNTIFVILFVICAILCVCVVTLSVMLYFALRSDAIM